MSRERLPLIGPSGSKPAAKPPLSSPAPLRPHQASRRKRSQQQQQQQPSSSSTSHPGPSSTFLSDTAMTPWGGVSLSESSFTSIPPPPPPPPPPVPPPAPQPTPSTPYRGRCSKGGEVSGSSPNSQAPTPPVAVLQETAGRSGRGVRTRRRALPQRRVPRPPRLPPLRPVTNLSFTRSFTFSFFELPLHQTPRCRAERIRDLMLLLRQIHY